MPDSSLAPNDRDAMIRTVLTEAASQDPEGWGAVASVIRNRLAAGTYGDTPTAVVRAPNQFEVWSNGRAQAVNPSSSQYEAAGRVVDAIANGFTDPTGGATHFYSPAGQRALGRAAPSWGRGQPHAAIGGQLFYAPQGAVKTGGPAQDAITEATAPQPKADVQMAAAGSGLTALKRWGVDVGDDDGKPDAPASPAPAPKGGGSLDALKRWGVDPDAQDTPKPAGLAPIEAAAPVSPGTSAKTGDASAAIGRGILNGIPIAGPYVLSGVEHAAAAARAIKENVPYSQALKEVQDFSAETAAANPGATTAGQIGGAVVGMAPAIAAAPGAFGMAAGPMLGRMAAGGVSNALIGAADATARGEDVAQGALFGGLGGSAGIPVGQAAGQGVNRLAQFIRGTLPTGIPGISRSAANLMNTAIDADGGHGVVGNALTRYGPDAMLADAGPSLTTVAGGLASRPAQEQAIVRGALESRAAGANDRIANRLTESLGPAEDPQAVTNNIRNLRSATNTAYQDIHANAPPVDVSAVVKSIDDRLGTATGAQRTALQRLRGELVAEPAYTDPTSGATMPEALQTSSQLLHNVRMDLDNVINHGTPGLGVEAGAVSRNNTALTSVRRQLDDTLKTQVPGMRETDARSAALAARQGAVERGYSDVLGAAGPHPETFAAERAANPPGVNIAENKGIRGRIDRMFGTGTQRDAVTLNKLLAGGDDGYAAANLRTAFGDEPTSALLDTLARERAFADTTQSVTRNSETARRTAANKLLDATQPGGMDLKSSSATGLALQAGKSILLDPLVRMIMESPNAPRNLELARMMTAQGASRDQIMAQLTRLSGAQQTVSGVGNALQRALSSGTNRLLLAAGATTR